MRGTVEPISKLNQSSAPSIAGAPSTAEAGPELRMMRPSDVVVDPEVQRGYREYHAKTIAKSYDPAKWGLAHVSQRPDGTYVWIDGQHRSGAAYMAGKEMVPVLVQVYRGLTVAQEAALFDQLNKNRLPVGAFDAFRLRSVAGDSAAVTITAILNDVGLRAAPHKSRGCVFAVAALESVYFGLAARRTAETKVRPDLLRSVLSALKDAWGDESSAYDAILIKGVGQLLLRHGALIEHRDLVRVLAKHTPQNCTRQIAAFREASRNDALSTAVQFFENIYNAGQRNPAKKLPTRS